MRLSQPRLDASMPFATEATIMAPSFTRLTVTLDVVVPDGQEPAASVSALERDIRDAQSSRYLVLGQATWGTT